MERHGFDTALLVAPPLMLRRGLHLALRAAGVRVVLEAASGAEALSLLASTLVQLVLTSWELPDLAGAPLLGALRNHGRNHGLPVVLLDAGLPRASVVAAVKAGAAGRLALPADAQAVRTLLQRIAAEQPAAHSGQETRPLGAAPAAGRSGPSRVQR